MSRQDRPDPVPVRQVVLLVLLEGVLLAGGVVWLLGLPLVVACGVWAAAVPVVVLLARGEVSAQRWYAFEEQLSSR